MRSIDPSLLSKINQQNQTIWNNANPKMSIQVSRAKDTVMDSTYWTVETIRAKEGLGDTAVAARRFKPYGSPNRLYNIYVDNGMVKTAIREYPDHQKEKWQTQFSIEAGSAVAIAFDGHWEKWRKRWYPVTAENPHLFWVNSGNRLYCQVWDDESTKVELATDVVKVKALRGWKNVNYPEIDQGVVCAYIKTDGKVYYRNYAWQALSEQFGWENERQIAEFSGSYVNLNIFITNDYRLGIIVESNSGNISYVITDRAWAGMAIAPEKFRIRAKANIEFIKIKIRNGYTSEFFDISANAGIAFLYADGANKFKTAANISDGQAEENYGLFISFTTQHELFDLDRNDFELADENNVIFKGQDISKLSKLEYLIKFDDFNNAVGECQLICKGLSTTNEAGYLFDEFSMILEPINLVPDETGAPEVEAIWNE